MRFVVNYAKEAQDQLDRITQWYLEQGGWDVAFKWSSGMTIGIDSLGANPGRCNLARESDNFPFDLYEYRYGSGRRTTHRVLFRICGDEVRILTIRHVAQRDVGSGDISG